jgi:hypothetical protein
MFGAYAQGYGGTYAAVGRPEGSRYSAVGGPESSRSGRSVGADLCTGQTAGLTDWPIERIAQTVEPNDAQRAVLDELKDATAKALDILKAACPTALPSTPTGRKTRLLGGRQLDSRFFGRNGKFPGRSLQGSGRRGERRIRAADARTAVQFV